VEEPGVQCLEHLFDLFNAFPDDDKTLWWIYRTLRFTAALPLGLRFRDVLIHLGDLATEDFGEESGLGTFGRLCPRYRLGDCVGERRSTTIAFAGPHCTDLVRESDPLDINCAAITAMTSPLEKASANWRQERHVVTRWNTFGVERHDPSPSPV
jgi:hypothetical protein